MAPSHRALAVLFGVAALFLTAPSVSATEAEGGEEIEFTDEAAEECHALLEEGGTVDSCQEAPNPILPELNEIIWGTLAFLVILGGLAWKGLPAIRKAMDDRTEKIRTSLDEAEAARAEAESIRAQYAGQLAEARTESSRIIEESRGQADELKRRLTTEAEAEAAQLRQRNNEQLESERARLMGEVQGSVATLAVELAEKVVEANLDRDANLRLIENYINRVGANGPSAGNGGGAVSATSPV